jgi:hypothetical protein
VYPPAASAAQYRHDHRRAAGASRQIAYNEIPRFGRITIHDQLERRRTGSGKETISLNFAEQDAPVLVATALQGPRVRTER